MVFPLVMYRYENWTVKKSEHWRIDVFKLRCWRRFLSSLESKEVKPVNLKGNQPWILFGRTDAAAPILWHLMWTTDSLKKTLMLRKIKGRWKRGRQRMRCLDGITDSMNMSLRKLWEKVKNRKAWHAAVHRVTKSWTWLRNWRTTVKSGKHPYRNMIHWGE